MFTILTLSHHLRSGHVTVRMLCMGIIELYWFNLGSISFNNLELWTYKQERNWYLQQLTIRKDACCCFWEAFYRTNIHKRHPSIHQSHLYPPLRDEGRPKSSLPQATPCNPLLVSWGYFLYSLFTFCITIIPEHELKHDTILHKFSFQTTRAYGKLSQTTPPSLFGFLSPLQHVDLFPHSYQLIPGLACGIICRHRWCSRERLHPSSCHQDVSCFKQVWGDSSAAKVPKKLNPELHF